MPFIVVVGLLYSYRWSTWDVGKSSGQIYAAANPARGVAHSGLCIHLT